MANNLQLPDELWETVGPGKRSQELTALSVSRYTGTRTGGNMLAHNFWELTVVMGGTGYLVTPGENKRAFCEGMLVLIPPGCMHDEISNTVLDTIWIAMQGSVFASSQTDNLQTLIHLPATRMAEDVWSLSLRRSPYIGMQLEGKLRELLGLHFAAGVQENRPTSDVIDQAIDYVKTNFTRQLSIGMIAARFGISEGYLHREFRRRVGTSPVQFITRLRIEQASNAIRYSSDTIDRIARCTGYSDPLYFSRLFSRYVGVSPAEFRKRCREE